MHVEVFFYFNSSEIILKGNVNYATSSPFNHNVSIQNIFIS